MRRGLVISSELRNAVHRALSTAMMSVAEFMLLTHTADFIVFLPGTLQL